MKQITKPSGAIEKTIGDCKYYLHLKGGLMYARRATRACIPASETTAPPPKKEQKRGKLPEGEKRKTMSANELNQRLLGQEVALETNDRRMQTMLRRRGNNLFIIKENDAILGIFEWQEITDGVFLAEDESFLGQKIYRKLMLTSRG